MVVAEFDLTGAVALVTGGNRGIGRGIALGLARAGADIAIAARDQQRIAGVVEEVRALGRRAVGICCDVTDKVDLCTAVEQTQTAFGKLTILVNNAGINRPGLPEALSEADWDAVVDTNLKAMFLLSQVAYPALKANGGGKIINIASEYSLFGSVRGIAYSASKGGVVQLTKSLASAWAKDNIQVNAILPGAIRTEVWGGLLDNPAFTRMLASKAPAARMGEPEEMGGLAIFLASRASDFVSGQFIAIDGGLSTADPTQDYVERSASS